MDRKKWVIVCLFICIWGLSAKVIEVIPPSHEEAQPFFSDTRNKPYESLGLWDKIQYKIEEKGHLIRTTNLENVPRKIKKWYKKFPWNEQKKDVDLLISVNLPYYMHSQKIFNIPRQKIVLLMMEPPSVIPEQYEIRRMKKHFYKIFTFDDSLVDNETIFQFYYPVCYVKECRKIPFNKKKLLCTISANKSSRHPNELYSERKKAIAFFDQLPDGIFDLYGIGWEGSCYKHYAGTIPNKIDVMENYKFSICYENISGMRGYITEKIFDAFEAGCIPIYLGAENITDYIPENCFIDKRQFATYEQLYHFIETMDETTYTTYIKNIDLFLSSEKAQKYNPENFINLIVDVANS